MITFDKATQVFHLKNDRYSYVIQIEFRPPAARVPWQCFAAGARPREFAAAGGV